MENSFIPGTWRWGDIPNRLLHLGIGSAQYQMIRETLIEESVKLIYDVFPRSNIRVDHSISEPNFLRTNTSTPRNEVASIPISGAAPRLEHDGSAARFSFEIALFNQYWCKFEVTKIPAKVDNRQIRLFFGALSNVVRIYANAINRGPGSRENGSRHASRELMYLSDYCYLSLRKAVICEYLFCALNWADENYNIEYSFAPKGCHLSLSLIEKAYNFATELLSRTIENRPIQTGIAFHQKVGDLKKNCAQLFHLKQSVPFGDFDRSKHLLEMANGDNTWLNVSKGHLAHLFALNKSISDRWLDRNDKSDRICGRPFFLAIRGPRNALFIDGLEFEPKVLLQIQAGQPVIQDDEYVRDILKNLLVDYGVKNMAAKRLVPWLVSLSRRRHGTTVFIMDPPEDLDKLVVKAVSLSARKWHISDERSVLSFLNTLSNTDGALILDNKLTPKYSGVITPIKPSSTNSQGGSRHNSARCFTEEYRCLGIVVSDDGPISVFNNGEKVASL